MLLGKHTSLASMKDDILHASVQALPIQGPPLLCGLIPRPSTRMHTSLLPTLPLGAI